jgi:DNA-binding NtrC family response regulator
MNERDDKDETFASRPTPMRHSQDNREDAEYSVLVGRTVAEVERELILETLRQCHGNRTHAANVLGISIRTLRNKLHEYADDGVSIPPPAGGGEVRVAG